jgi:hypothetical protein
MIRRWYRDGLKIDWLTLRVAAPLFALNHIVLALWFVDTVLICIDVLIFLCALTFATDKVRPRRPRAKPKSGIVHVVEPGDD